jgi:hypothetical protein
VPETSKNRLERSVDRVLLVSGQATGQCFPLGQNTVGRTQERAQADNEHYQEKTCSNQPPQAGEREYMRESDEPGTGQGCRDPEVED